MDNKMLLGLGVLAAAGAGVYFYTKKKEGPDTPQRVLVVRQPSVVLLAKAIQDASVSSGTTGQLAGAVVSINGAGNTIDSLMSQIRQREIESGVA